MLLTLVSRHTPAYRVSRSQICPETIISGANLIECWWIAVGSKQGEDCAAWWRNRAGHAHCLGTLVSIVSLSACVSTGGTCCFTPFFFHGALRPRKPQGFLGTGGGGKRGRSLSLYIYIYISLQDSIPLRFSFLFKKVLVCGHCPVTLSLTINETLKGLSSLPVLMQESFWWWQCSYRYIISLCPRLHNPFPFLPVPNKPHGFRGR